MRSVVWITFLTANQGAINALMGGGGETAWPVRRQLRLALARFCPRPCRWSNQLLKPGQEGLPATAELDLAQIAPAVQHTVSERLLIRESLEHALFNRVAGDQVDHRHRAGLMFAPGAGNPLFQFRRVPGQVAVDDDAGILQI